MPSLPASNIIWQSLTSKFLVLVFIFSFSVEANAEPKRPLIFVPGIIGSKLCKGGIGVQCEGGVVLWGDVWSLSNIKELTISHGPRLPDDGIRPASIIDRISLFGLIKVEEYAHTLYTRIFLSFPTIGVQAITIPQEGLRNFLTNRL